MKLKISLILISVLIFASCENQLEKEPDFISETTVFEDEKLTEAYLAQVYQAMPFIDVGGQSQLNMGMIPAAGAEHINFANWQTPNSTYRRNYSASSGPGPLNYWAYGTMRNINYLLENIVDSESLSEEYITQVVSEARFLRAYAYFEMAKRFGGVPLITKVQSADDPEEELYPARNTEQEIYEFVISELEDVIPLLTDVKKGAVGRIDRYVAQALLSRVALHAASIGNFGEVQIGGLVGVNPGDAQAYYQKSYDMSKAIMESGQFMLYNNFDDKVQNFTQLFLDEGNDEVIFAEIFEPIVRGHSLDYLATPDGFNATWNSNFPVLYDFVEMFDFVDGRKGTDIDRSELVAGNSWDINDFFGNRDPRFKASVFYPESMWQGSPVYFHSSTIYTENGEQKEVTSGTLDRNGEDWPAACPPRNARNTALLLRKRVDESNQDLASERSGQDFYVFRYAEILLNYAEAAYYLGMESEALDAVNQIRERAGMPLLTSISEAEIRHERQVELAFESHRFWDLIRWRIAPQYLDAVRTKGLVFKYDLDTERYIITLKNAEPNERAFGPERYYLPISLGLMADNPNLEQNPGYE